jgi:hypothetical protein
LKEGKYFLALNDNEQSILIRALNDFKTDRMKTDKAVDVIDELIIKVGKAPLKKFKVVEKGFYNGAR